MAAAFVGTRIQHGGKILYLSVSGSLRRDRDFISGTGVCRYGDCRDRTWTFISGAADPDLCAAVSVDDGRSRQKKQTVCVSSEDRDGREEQQAVFSVLFCGFAGTFFGNFDGKLRRLRACSDDFKNCLLKEQQSYVK